MFEYKYIIYIDMVKDMNYADCILDAKTNFMSMHIC